MHNWRAHGQPLAHNFLHHSVCLDFNILLFLDAIYFGQNQWEWLLALRQSIHQKLIALMEANLKVNKDHDSLQAAWLLHVQLHESTPSVLLLGTHSCEAIPRAVHKTTVGLLYWNESQVFSFAWCFRGLNLLDTHYCINQGAFADIGAPYECQVTQLRSGPFLCLEFKFTIDVVLDWVEVAHYRQLALWFLQERHLTEVFFL